LPSWVPDWTSGGPEQTGLSGSFYEAKSRFSPEQYWDFTNNELEAPGKIFDTVANIIHDTPYMISSPTLRDLQTLISHFKEMEAWDDECWELVRNLEQYPTGENIWSAYWRALICNTERVGVEATENLEIAYKTWMSLYITGNECFELFKTHMVPAHADADGNPTSTPESRGWILSRLATELSNRWQKTSVMFQTLTKHAIMQQQAKVSAPFDSAFKRYSFGRKFCTTEHGYMGWVPFNAKTGDQLCYFRGCKLPFVIRHCEDGHGYRLIGDSYLHGLMYDAPKSIFLRMEQTIILV